MKRLYTLFLICLTLSYWINIADAQVAFEAEEEPILEVEVVEADEELGHEVFTSAGPKIEGPWLWMIASTGQEGGRAAAASGRDYLAAASGGTVKENRIARNGVKAGALVGNRAWTRGRLAPTGGNNINDLVTAIGLGSGDIDNHVAYGSIALNSPRKQKTTMHVGSDDAVKVWLNGKLVHDNPIDRGASDYQDDFPVTLKKGKNILLVAVYERGEAWSGFFGFEKGTAYRLIMPSVLPNKGVIPDRILAARVRSRLGLGPNANLTKQKMRKLTQLSANDAGIKDLTGLEHAAQLRSLSLVGNQIRDISPLAGLKNLQVLSVSENQLEGTGALFTLLKKIPNLELDITIPMKEHPPIYWLTGSLIDQNENITRPDYIQRLTSVSANVETLWESTGPISGNTHQLAVDTVVGKLYWTEQINESRSELKRANLDGSAPQKLATLRSVLTSIAVDPKKRKLYWTNSDGRIQRANLNGKQIKTLVEHLDAPTNLTVDVDAGKLYWVEGHRIWRSDLNGKNIKRVITAASDTGEVIVVSSIAVAAGKIYWNQVERDATKYPNSFIPAKVGGRILRADL